MLTVKEQIRYPVSDTEVTPKRNGTADNTISEVRNILGGLHWQKDMTEESEDGTGNNLRRVMKSKLSQKSVQNRSLHIQGGEGTSGK